MAKKSSSAGRSKAYYSLKKVRRLVDESKHNPDKVLINPNALETAERDFGWRTPDILNALKKLQPKHFDKSEPSIKRQPSIQIDSYKAVNLMGENIYTHFYIEEDQLVVNSFKKK